MTVKSAEHSNWARGLVTAGHARLRRLVGPAGSLQATLVTGVPLLFLFLFATHVLEQAGLLHRFEYFAFDTFSRAGKVPQSEHVVLVVIDDNDHQELFGGRSPLSAGPRQHQPLFDAIKTIAAADPRVIGVDLDTSDTGFTLPTDFPTNVVWARDARLPREPRGRTEHEALPVVVSGRFIGDNSPVGESGTNEHASEERHRVEQKSGITFVASDKDGVVRRYWRMVSSYADEPPGDHSPDQRARLVDAFPWAIVREFCRDHTGPASVCRGCQRIDEAEKHAREHGEPVIIRFSSDRRRFQRIQLSKLLKDAEAGNLSWIKRLFNDKIVLIGGEYRTGRDVHTTPVGERFGVDILADIVEMEVEGRSIGETDFRLAAAYDVLAGVALLLVQWKFRFDSRGRWVSLASIGFICVLTVVGSWLIFDALTYWFNLAAPLAGVQMHLAWERESKMREMKKELEECRHEIIRLKQANSSMTTNQG